MLSSYLNPLPSLPTYCGPHKVGTCEFEIPVSEIPSTSRVPNPQVTTIKFRLFYPTTLDATSKQSVYWLPTPQKQWNEAYASFMGTSPGWSGTLTSGLLKLWNYTKLPVVSNGPLLVPAPKEGFSALVFSHGLGGNCNAYSSVVGNLASCGVVCVALEHRDGSAPTTFIRNSKRETERSIPYQKHSHAPNAQVLNARNTQLRVRLWELELTYAVINAMNEGKTFTNYAEIDSTTLPNLKGQLDLRPGKMSWAGHSFGAATITQFVKSVFYHQHLPLIKPKDNTNDDGWDWEPLYKSNADSDLVRQITATSPVALLDLWTMPLRGEPTKWLWESPMPCYSRQSSPERAKPNTIAIISAEFYKWTDLLNRTRAVLSRSPGDAFEEVARTWEAKEAQVPSLRGDKTRPTNPIPELSKHSAEELSQTPDLISSANSAESSREASPTRSQPKSIASSQTSLVPSDHEHRSSHPSKSSVEPHLYLVPQSAHLSQSDFGVLFPNLTKYVMKAVEPEKTLELNVRAVLAVMRGQGLPVEALVPGDDHILDSEKTDKKERWVRVPLVDA